MKKEYQEIINACKKGGEIVAGYFGKTLEITEKTRPSDLKTKADHESEEEIIKHLKEHFPDYNIDAEEYGRVNNGSEYTFIIDPLDGTNNFVLGIPYFSATIALQRNNRTIFAVTHNPILKTTYWAEKGQGAFLNDKRLAVSREVDMQRVTVAFMISYDLQSTEWHSQAFKNVICRLKAKRELQNWCPSLDFCLLAEGKIEAIINKETELHDFAAGKLIAREAGAIIKDFSGQDEENENNDQFIVCNSEEVCGKIINILN